MLFKADVAFLMMSNSKIEDRLGELEEVDEDNIENAKNYGGVNIFTGYPLYYG